MPVSFLEFYAHRSEALFHQSIAAFRSSAKHVQSLRALQRCTTLSIPVPSRFNRISHSNDVIPQRQEGKGQVESLRALRKAGLKVPRAATT